MRFFFFLILFCLKCLLLAEHLSIIPPKGWDCVSDPEQLPQKVSLIYIGKGKTPFTPSLNIASEETSLELEKYLALAKSYHEAQGDSQCKQLGTIETKAGNAQLLQIDKTTQWGHIRFIQAVILKDSKAYVVTATSLQEEFASLSPCIFKSIQSFSITK
ncbi:MAG: hypothetical protein R3E91_05600 [Chlamydiales bacterium]